jgi:hypothetical protein
LSAAGQSTCIPRLTAKATATSSLCRSFPSLSKNLLLAMLITILLIALECIIFIKNRQVISGMNRASVLQRHVLESIAYHYEAVFIGNCRDRKSTRNIHSVHGG